MTRSTLFKSNRSQAVRLPKAVAFPTGVHQVEITKVGDSRWTGCGASFETALRASSG
jgi:hypothetical protein